MEASLADDWFAEKRMARNTEDLESSCKGPMASSEDHSIRDYLNPVKSSGCMCWRFFPGRIEGCKGSRETFLINAFLVT